MRTTLFSLLAVGAIAGAPACARGPSVATSDALTLRRVVVYRNGVGYFERRGTVSEPSVDFHVRQADVGDFLATLAVMERGGSSVQSAAFPMPTDSGGPDARRTVHLQLDGQRHDLTVGYTIETPVWRPSYRLVFGENGPEVQAWGIVQNLSGEDWTNVSLSLVSGAPVSFRSDLAEAILTDRPTVTDRGEVLDVVPRGNTSLAQQDNVASGVPAQAAFEAEQSATEAFGSERREVFRRPTQAPARSRAGGRATVADPDDGLMPATPAAPAGGDMSGYTSRPRSVSSLAAVAAQGGTTRYDLPAPVTVPDHAATMVLLAAREVPGERVYLFAPEPGVTDSMSHPFHVARMTNTTGALFERGPVAIFEAGAFLGQGVLEPLPDGASATVPFALERALAVQSNVTYAVEGARLLRIFRGEITIERYRTTRTSYTVRNGLDRDVRMLVKHQLGGELHLHQPPEGTEEVDGAALVPVNVPRQGRTEVELQSRIPYAQQTTWEDENTAAAIEEYLRTGSPTAEVAAVLRASLEHRSAIITLATERDGHATRSQDLRTNSEETRQNLEAIRRNPRAGDLRAQLTQRLSQMATEIDQVTRRIVELDTQIGERRVRLLEAVRTLDVNTAIGSTAAGTRRGR